MYKSNARIMRDSERFLKRTKEYQENRYKGNDENYEIHFVLKKTNKDILTDVIAYAAYQDVGLSFHPYGEVAPLSFNCFDWSFSYDDNLYDFLEDGYEIAAMSMDSHFCIWTTIEEWQNEEINHPAGMQMYLAYCKRNGISINKLREAVSYSGIDVMKFYDGKTKHNITDMKPRDDFNR